jgi:hypothetical protein
MKRWTHVKWTEAGQVAAVLGWEPDASDGQTPEARFDGLRAEGRDGEAAFFLGQALPRYEAVAWATRAVRDLAPAEPSSPEGEAMKSALLWLQDPSDGRRRAAFEAAQRAADPSPQRLCALAVFFSGGSMAPDHLQPVPPPKDVAGKFAAGAVLLAATASGRRDEALAGAFSLGEELACGRTGAR